MCPTPGETPTVGSAPIPGPIGPLALGIFQRLVRTDQPESTKRAVVLLAACTLCVVEMILALATYYQAVVYEKVDGQLVFALLGVSASVAALAGASYRKKEDEPAAPPAETGGQP